MRGSIGGAGGRFPAHLAAVEHVVDVLDEGLVLDLGVAEKEDHWLGRRPGPCKGIGSYHSDYTPHQIPHAM